MHDSSPAERRLTVRLLSYWERLRNGRLMPIEADIDPEQLADLWDYCFLIHTKDLGKEDYNFTYLGDAIIKAYHGGLSAAECNGLLAPNAQTLAQGYQQVLNTHLPLVEEGEFHDPIGQIVKYRQCLLPLGEQDAVTAIFGGMRFKVEPG